MDDIKETWYSTIMVVLDGSNKEQVSIVVR